MDNRLILNNGNYLLNEKKPITSYLGINDIGAIMGLSKYRTAVSVFNEKARGIKQDFDIAQKIASSAKTPLIDWYCEKMEAEGYRDVLVENSATPFLSAKVDFLSKDQKFACITKVTTMDNRSLYSSVELDSFMPTSLKVKANYIMILTGVEHVDVIVMFSATSRVILRCTRDDEISSKIAVTAVEFWEGNVKPDIMPEITTLQDFKVAYPRVNGSEIEANSEILDTIERLKEIQAERKGIEATVRDFKKYEEEFELKIRKFSGDNGVITYDNEKLIRISTINRPGYTVKPVTYTTLRIL